MGNWVGSWEGWSGARKWYQVTVDTMLFTIKTYIEGLCLMSITRPSIGRAE